MQFECLMGNSIRALGVSSIGDFFIVGGVNKSLRKFEQTKEQYFAVQLEQEQREAMLIETEMKRKLETSQPEIYRKQLKRIKFAEELMDYIDRVESKSKDAWLNYEN